MRSLALGLVAAVASLAAAVGGAAAQEPAFGTVAFFYPHCKASLDDSNNSELFRQGQCSGMLMGVHFVSEELSKNYKFCSPNNLEVGDLVKAAVQYIEAHPDRMTTPMLETAVLAFKEKWPCAN